MDSDNNSDVYDTSEKARIPAWTDRVLFRGPATLRAYDRAELRSSDHRPVYAILEVEVREVDQKRKAAIMAEITGRANVGLPSRGDKMAPGVDRVNREKEAGMCHPLKTDKAEAEMRVVN